MSTKTATINYTATPKFLSELLSADLDLADMLPAEIQNVSIHNNSEVSTVSVRAGYGPAPKTTDSGIHLTEKGGTRPDYVFGELSTNRTTIVGSGNGSADIVFDAVPF